MINLSTNKHRRVKQNISYLKMCKVSNVLKLITFIACAIGFLEISWHLLMDFLSGSTIVSSNYIKMNPNETLLSPSILICNQTGFKSSQISTNLEDYLNNTIEYGDLFVDFGFMNQNYVPRTIDKIRPIYTPYKGRCFVFEPSIKVSSFLTRNH